MCPLLNELQENAYNVILLPPFFKIIGNTPLYRKTSYKLQQIRSNRCDKSFFCKNKQNVLQYNVFGCNSKVIVFLVPTC